MASIAEQHIVIKLSKLVKDSSDSTVLDKSVLENLEPIIEEVINDPKVVVEVLTDDE